MSVRKFMGIWRKVDGDVGLNGETEIKFEWGDAVTPAVHYIFDALRVEDEAIVVSVEPVRATCKPRDEWWMRELAATVGASSCCATSVSAQGVSAGTGEAVVNVLDIPVGAAALPASAPCCN
jgi:hypothetical protein